MRFFVRASFFGLALLVTMPVFAENDAHIGNHVTTPEDIAAITQVTADFQQALIKKDSKGLSALMFNSNILFATPAGETNLKRIRAEKDINFDGVAVGGFTGFAKSLEQSTEPIEEKFYNIKITQDGHVAWVMFDFEFLKDGKVGNYGVESWQMYKVDGKWKILSVVWSSHGAPK
jgi:hypothetical protein